MNIMGCALVLFLLLPLAFYFPLSSSTLDNLSEGTSLSVEKPEEVLISPNGVFSAGFHSVGDNAFCFAIWFNKQPSPTVVWMANRDHPVNGKHSKLSLLKNGNLILTDANKLTIWATDTVSLSPLQLSLYNTDTLLPQQPFTRNTKLVSSRSQTNISSGFYELFFDNDNLLRLRYNGPEMSSNFSSSDELTFKSTDYGAVLHRRLTLDYDGNMRLYSWKEETQTWVVSWQAIQKPCMIHAACGVNSLCSYVGFDRKCFCLPGYKMKNSTDWGYGCEPNFHPSCNKNESDFMLLSNIQFLGYDYGYFANYTFDQCRDLCLKICGCNAFQYTYRWYSGTADCYPKTLLLNGYHSPDFNGDFYLRLPKSKNSSYAKPLEEFNLYCPSKLADRPFVESYENGTVKFMFWFASGVAVFEIICILVVWCLLIITQKSSSLDKQGYVLAATVFRKFSYAELKKATKGFTEEIGRGAWGAVYKGVLSDNRVAAIKRLNEANQGEGEFLAEVSIIGRINHMNLIEMWGYCAEGKHRLLVYEFMEHGSLADNLSANALNWEKMFEVAVGTAKGLAYLHEECLDWILHCDVKPQNILLDSNYLPKVADFGLSKLQNRGILQHTSFSRIRGTRGYMAPEWVFNLPITSKVDVYSYGIVMLEMVTGNGPSRSVHAIDDGAVAKHKMLVTWVREKISRATSNTSLLEEIIDPMLKGKYEMGKMETLVGLLYNAYKKTKMQDLQ
uniref:Receptor-like serine/threonine-protein kinase n=1 Tax=Fagus sylvatica TaxID=28930 RepID=A0A2N9FUZ8_FAGSY